MSCKYVSAAIAVFAIIAAVAESLITPTQIESCLKLNDIDKLLVAKDDVYKSLKACDTIEEVRANLTIAAEAIYFVYKAVVDAEYLQLHKLVKDTSKADQIHECVKAATVNAQNNVGLEGKHSLGLDVNRCKQSFGLRTCSEDAFYNNSSLTVDAKAQKNILMKAFDVIDAICEETMVRADRSNSQQLIPSVPVTFGSALMLLKLFVCVM